MTKISTSPSFLFAGIVAFSLAATFPVAVQALGTRLPDQGAAATARGNAFTATADNPSAIYYNPAGITQLEGTQFSAGAYLIDFQSKYTSPSGPAGKIRAETDNNPQAVPHLYLTHNFSDYNISAGVGVYTPYGLSNQYKEDVPFRTVAQKGSIQYISVAPVIAVKVHRTLSIAGGLSYNHASAELSQGIFAPGDKSRFKGDDSAVGYQFGILWQPTPKHSFGASYHSATEMEFRGDLENGAGPTPLPEFLTSQLYFPRRDATASYKFPQYFVLGYSFRPTPAWNFEFNYDWTDWDSLNDVTITGNDGKVITKLPFNWKSSAFYEFGATHYFNKGWSVSAGYIYSENSVPEENFNPIVPDSNRHIFSGGIGYKNDAWSVNLAYQYAHGPERTLSRSISPSLIGESANGTYEFNSHAISLDVGFAF